MPRLEELRKMLAEEPGDAFLHYALGLELIKLLQYQEAIAAFQATLAADETYAAAYYQLGKIFADLDIVDVAKDYYAKGEQLALAKNDRKAAGEFREAIELLE